MVTSSRYLEAPQRLRAFVRAHEASLVVLALLIGTIGGLAVAAMSAAVEGLHVVLFNLEWGDRLSSQFRIEPLRALLVPSLGGLAARRGVPAVAALAAGARNRPDRGQCPAWRADVVSRQRDRGAADGLVQRRRRLGRTGSGLYPVGQRDRGIARPRLSSAPRRSAHHGGLRRRGRDRRRVRRAAGRRLLCVRTGDRRLYAGQPDAGRRRRGGRLFRDACVFAADARRRRRSGRRRARARPRGRGAARDRRGAGRHRHHARRGAVRGAAGENRHLAAAAPGARRSRASACSRWRRRR